MEHKKAMKEAMKRAIRYLQTPQGKKEFEENRRNSLDLQAMMYEAKKEVFDDFMTLHNGIYKKGSGIDNEEKLPARWFIRDIVQLRKKHLHN